MVIITLIALILLIKIFLFFVIFFVIPFLFGAPYDVTRKNAMKNIVKLASSNKKDKIAELGSGDGRVCIELAKKNPLAQIHGFEINPILVWISRRKIKKLKLQNRIKIYWKSFWKINFKDYNKLVLFQFKTVMKRMENKINKELRPKSHVISHNWKLPHHKIKKKLGKKKALSGEVYLYEK
jgi:16S rRNA A1518/A1519 N6-dimethyltransferase RsmA/KsgA/DIM1 with predicted DNA glycosylase/AP lyase activity